MGTTIFHFILLAQICTNTGCYTVPQAGDVVFQSPLACEQYKQQFIGMANGNKFRYSVACQGPKDKSEATLSNGLFPTNGDK